MSISAVTAISIFEKLISFIMNTKSTMDTENTKAQEFLERGEIYLRQELDRLKNIVEEATDKSVDLSQLHKDYISMVDINESNLNINDNEKIAKIVKTLFYYEWICNARPDKTKEQISHISKKWLARYRAIFKDNDGLDIGLKGILEAENFKDLLNIFKNAGATIATVGSIILIILPALGVGVGLLTAVSIFLLGIPGGQLFGGIVLLILAAMLAGVKMNGKYLELMNALIEKTLEPDFAIGIDKQI